MKLLPQGDVQAPAPRALGATASAIRPTQGGSAVLSDDIAVLKARLLAVEADLITAPNVTPILLTDWLNAPPGNNATSAIGGAIAKLDELGACRAALAATQAQLQAALQRAGGGGTAPSQQGPQTPGPGAWVSAPVALASAAGSALVGGVVGWWARGVRGKTRR